MNHPLQTLIGVAQWGGQNFLYNLKFIPADKLTWKPEPTAKSAAEIAAEVAGAVTGLTKMIQNTPYEMAFPTITTHEEANAAIEAAIAGYVAVLQSMGADDLGGEVQFPWGAVPKLQALSFPMVELLHHHGQIAYIQSLLGDTESHFFELGS